MSFLFGAAVGAIAGGIVSFIKNPSTGNPIRSDVKSAIDGFGAAAGRAKHIYDELEEKRKYPEQSEKVEKEDTETGASEAEEKVEVAKPDTETGASEEEKHENTVSNKQVKEAELKVEKVMKPKIVRTPQHVTFGEKVEDFTDAITHASFKLIDHKVIFAKIKHLFTRK